jgi:hypothetical protein
MVAGGIGGTIGDLLMHSLDTVKTRQQGDPHFPPRYAYMSSAYYKIFREEGVRRGLYGGVTPAFLGSLPGTIIFFGVYEKSKRMMLEHGVNEHVTYLSAGFLADLFASVVYVPSEVLKTRLQLQGRYNNPFFDSGYNYRSTMDAARTIVQKEGFPALYHGYKATIMRDLPFSALQFAFYEQGQKWSRQWKGSKEIGLPLECITAAAAGGLAGLITCPLDVVKTRLQTQLSPSIPPISLKSIPTSTTKKPSTSPKSTIKPHHDHQTRPISTSSPSTTAPRPGAPTLDTNSILRGLRVIYRTEGLAGCFRGVGPRLVWTSVQSCTMLVLYQTFLKQIALFNGDEYVLIDDM